MLSVIALILFFAGAAAASRWYRLRKAPQRPDPSRLTAEIYARRASVERPSVPPAAHDTRGSGRADSEHTA